VTILLTLHSASPAFGAATQSATRRLRFRHTHTNERLDMVYWRQSGRTPEYGSAKMIEGMKMMLGWHFDAFSVLPVGAGWDIQVHEFDFRDNAV